MVRTSLPVQRPGGAVAAPEMEQAFATEVESWLRHHVVAAPPVTWSPRGNGLIAVRSVDEIAERVSGLLTEGSWAVARRTHASLWAQCMRVDGGWIVEVNGVPGPACFTRRVQQARGRPRLWQAIGRRRVYDAGHLMADYLPHDVLTSPLQVAQIMWAWLRASSLPDGYALRDL